MTDPNTHLLAAPQARPQLEKPKKKSHIAVISIIALILFVLIATIGIASRAVAERNLKKRTQETAVTTVSVITAEKGAETETVVLPGTVQAWHEATVYARTSGYLKTWAVDIGARVKAGEVLATIDAPDLDAQFHQAQADLNTAEANNKLAQLTAKRYVQLLKLDSVSKQQVDTEVATAEADQAMVESQKANLDHLQQEENFKDVIAPFDGTITQRNTDVGSLITGSSTTTTTSTEVGGSNTTGQDLFHIADVSKLRVYVQVPETYTNAIKKNLQAEMHVPQHPQQVFPASLSRSADALDPTTRTLLIELEVENPDNMLFAGGYTDVSIKVPSVNETVLLPVNALLFRDGMHVGVLDGDHVRLKSVKIGRDYGKTVEILDGISPGDQIVINPPDSLVDGEQVRIVKPDDAKDTPADAKIQPNNKIGDAKVGNDNADDIKSTNHSPADSQTEQKQSEDITKQDDPKKQDDTK